jgi:hypothetical protein
MYRRWQRGKIMMGRTVVQNGFAYGLWHFLTCDSSRETISVEMGEDGKDDPR